MIRWRPFVAAALTAAGLAALVANAALPSVQSIGRVTPTPSGFVNTKYPDGNDGATQVALVWGTCPAISIVSGQGVQQYDQRTRCALAEPGSPAATITVSAGSLTGWSYNAGADRLEYSGTGEGTATLTIRATRDAAWAETTQQITVSAPPVGDSAEPSVPLALAATDNGDGTGTLSWDPSGDPNVAGVVTGVTQYQVKRNGSAHDTVTAPSANVQPLLTAYEVGLDTGESSTQAGGQWTLTYSGAGLVAASDVIYGRWSQVTGDYVATMKVLSFTPVSGTTGSIGIAARASNSAGDAIAVYSRWRDSDDKCNTRFRLTTPGNSSNGATSSAHTLPIWVRQTRAGDVFTTYCSTDGQTFTLTSSHTVSPGATVWVGPFVTGGAAGVNATAVVDDYTVTQAPQVSYVYTGAGGTFTVNAFDGANRSADSVSATLTTTGGATTLVTVPAATHTVCNSGCTYTPSQLATVAISQRVAGDVLELRTATAGGTEEWAARVLCNGVSGTNVAPIWVAVRDGDKIRFDDPTPASVGLVDLTDCDYWNFVGSRDGTATNLEIGDSSHHQPSCAQVGGSTFGCYPHSRSIMVRSSTGVAFVGTTIHGAKEHDASIVDKDSAKILFKYVEWSYDGHNAYNATSTTLAGKTSDSKDMAHVCATNVVMQDVYTHHHGHTPVIACGPYHVYRRTTWDGNWADHTTTPEYTGNHAATLIPGNHRSDYNTTTRFGPLVEDSLFYGSGSEPEHKTFQETIQLLGVNVIFRQNYIVQRAGTGNWGYFGPQALSLCASAQVSTSLRMAYVHAYHNTLWGGQVTNNSGSIGGVTTGHPADQCAGFKFKNNLFQGMQDGRLTSTAYAVHFQAPAAYTGYSNGWKGAEWFGNVFGQHPTLPSSYYQVRLNVSAGGTGSGTAALTNGVDANGDYDCADGGDSGTWPSNWCGNVSSALQWANATTTPIANGVTDVLPDPDTMRSVLTLSGSATYGIGDAWPLTTTTDAGTADTTLTLASARYFYDGWDNEDHTWGGLHTEYPDCICVGPTSTSTAAQCVVTQIQADGIDYSTGAITVSPGVTHAVGSRVWKATVNGDGTCGAVVDNRGAAQ